MNDAIIINDSYSTPDKYKLYVRKVIRPRWFFFWQTMRKELVLELKSSKKIIVLKKVWQRKTGKDAPKFDPVTGKPLEVTKEEPAVETNVWERIITLAERKYTIFLYENDNGTFSPLTLQKEEGKFSKEMIDTDMWRHFKNSTKNIREIARNKWSVIQKMIVIGFFGILSVAIIVVIFVLLNKFGIDHTTILKGANVSSSWLNSTTSKVLGA